MIETPRLRLIAATEAALRAEIASDHARLGALLRTETPQHWPPELYDADAIRYSLASLLRDPEAAAWGLRYFVLKGAPQRLVGAGGYKAPPHNGLVEIGYSILAEHRRRGYAAEATRGLVDRAFAASGVERVIAHTLPDLAASIGVLESCGFQRASETFEEGAVMFELSRPQWRAP